MRQQNLLKNMNKFEFLNTQSSLPNNKLAQQLTQIKRDLTKPKTQTLMQTIFRIYAKTTKQNDKYLFNQLVSMGLQPKYQELLHAFYFNANFNHLFKLSFQAFTAESLYLQLGHRYPLSTENGENEKSVSEFLKKINFRNYIPVQRGIVENTTLRLLIRESSPYLPSENVIISLFQNYLQKEVILKQYRKMAIKQQRDRLENYYDIKQIVQKKWQHEDIIKQSNKKLLLENQKQQEMKYLEGTGRNLNLKKQRKQTQEIEQYQEKINQLSGLFDVPYSPHFIMYIRRNHARLLLKINKESLYKFGWKKNVGWAPIRQTLTASILYRTGIIQHFKQKKHINLWDPFCGSGTIPLVALSMTKQLKIRHDHTSNFIWSNWPIYKQAYLSEYLNKSKQLNHQTKVNVLCSDIDINAVKNSVNNFKEFMTKNTQQLSSQQTSQQSFLQYRPSDQIYQILPKSIYVGCGDFQQLAQKILHNKNQKTTIITNLPYLGQRSKDHHPLNQLHSIYKRFNNMINKYKQYIANVFVIVDSDVHNSNHFVKVSKQEWRIMEHFSNGGIQVCLLGWSGNQVGWKEVEVYQQKINKGMQAYEEQKLQNLQEYRKEVKEVQNKRYQLPTHLDKKQGLRKNKRVIQKRRVRHMLAAYTAFAKRRDRNQIFEKYARKNLALRLSQRGKSWKHRNISLIQNKVQENEGIIRKQFQKRIQEAIQRSQKMKLRKKNKEVAIKKKW